MIDIHKLQKLADIIVNYSLALKKGEKLLIRGYGFDGYPLIKEIYREAVKVGALTIDVRFSTDELAKIFYENAIVKQLQYLDSIDLKVAENYDAMVQIIADSNPFELGCVDMKRKQIRTKTMKPLSDILHKKRWLLFYYPNLASAHTAKKSLEEWENFVLDACIKDWKKEAKVQEKLIGIMSKVKHIRVLGHETDLSLSVAGQKWRKCCGERNLPDGEVFTSPVRTSVNGYIRYNIPTRYMSKDFDFVKLWLKNGKVVKEAASHDVRDLTAILNTDSGSRYFGEFAFGLNHSILEPTREILFDEKISRSLHMALGKCYEEAPNGNDSLIHWDLVFCFDPAQAEIFFDGRKVYSKTKWTDPRFIFLNHRT
ncbi:aminopeptidase [Candidatus Peregrinibacteria bacterium]|nr:aminopeptidase [Candidatus Peregrinibacteria bacterium]